MRALNSQSENRCNSVPIKQGHFSQPLSLSAIITLDSYVCLWACGEIFSAVPTFSSFNPPFSLSFYFFPILPAYLDHFAFLSLRVQVAHSMFPPSLSILSCDSLGFPLPPSINLSVHPPLQQPTQRLIPQRERECEDRHFIVFSSYLRPYRAVLNRTRHRPHSLAAHSIPPLFMEIFPTFLCFILL